MDRQSSESRPLGTATVAVRRWLVVAVLALTVFVASVITPPGTGSAGDSVTSGTGPLGLVGADKWFHATGYATLAVVAATAKKPESWWGHATILVAVAAFGGSIEVVQLFLPARAFDLTDAAVNTVGAALGLGCWLAYARLASSRSR
ncbi:VanZ family protein [Haloarchaeobius sp. DFWS5]|uniref:VanZ family protein n=1 Tax=Haloarchaeobius sp. DFWS5 TaxID=3446114 RepID=UPI003EBDA0D4